VRPFAARPLPARLVTTALFALAALSFVLPFLRVTADRRVAEATGWELATKSIEYSGTYVQLAFQGEAERWATAGEAPALLAVVLLVAAAVLVWLPWRVGPAVASGCGALALFMLFALYLRVDSQLALADVNRRYGLAVAALLSLAGTVWATLVAVETHYWWRPPEGDRHRRDYFAA
jgi:hypothetical protein